MDLAPFQIIYPELIIEHKRCAWFGEGLQYYNFIFQTWQNMASGAQALLFLEAQAATEIIDGGIKSAKILGEVDIALINAKEGVNSLIGLVRGKRLRKEGEEDFSLGVIEWGENSQATYAANDYEAPDFFSPEDDLRRELS